MLYRNRRPLFFFLAPALVLMLVMVYYPFALNIYNSLFDIKGLAATPDPFLGLENYRAMLEDPMMRIAFGNSMKMMVLVIVFQVGIALVLALLTREIRRGQQFFRSVYFFPIVVSATALGLMFNLFYAHYGGMLNQLLDYFGQEPITWMRDDLAFTMVAIPVLWQYVGFYYVILFTGLTGIPEELYEAASMDGASGLQQTRYVTLPLLSGVLLTCVTLAITGAVKIFDLPAMLAKNGAPKGLTYFLGTYMHNQVFVAGNVDYGSAIAIVIVMLGVGIAQITNTLAWLGEGRDRG